MHITTIASRLDTLADQQWQDLVLTRECVTRARALLETTLPRLDRAHCQPKPDRALAQTVDARCKASWSSARTEFVQRHVSRRTNSAQPQKLSARALEILANAYEIPASAAAIEAAALATWSLPFDELIAQICRVHGWKAEIGVVYVGALRSALLGREPFSPWLDE